MKKNKSTDTFSGIDDQEAKTVCKTKREDSVKEVL